MNIEFVNGTPYVSDLGFTGKAEYTPVYAIINGKKHFVRNVRRPLEGDSVAWREYDTQKSLQEAEMAKKSLRDHKGKFITFYSQKDDPFEFLDWIRINEYTLTTAGNLFLNSQNGDYTDFHGNCKEFSCAFYYRIYEKKLIDDLKCEVAKLEKGKSEC